VQKQQCAESELAEFGADFGACLFRRNLAVVKGDIEERLAFFGGARSDGAWVNVMLNHEVFVAGMDLGSFGVGVNGFKADAEFANVVEVFSLCAALY